MIRKLLTFSLLGMLIGVSASAQQDPLYGLYLNNPIMINPAYAGINDNFNINVGFRKQWAGFAGSPSTGYFSAHTSFLENRMGAGLKIVKDQLGEINNTAISVPIAYKIKLTDNQVLSFALEPGVMNYKSQDSKLNLQTPGDPAFGNVSQMKPVLGAGAMLKSERLLLGLSVPRLLNPTYNASGTSYTPYQQHYYLFGSYIFTVSERIQLRPSVLLKDTKGAPLSADVNFNVNIDRLYTVGLYTRNLNSYGFLAQITVDKFRFAYAFELPTSNSVGTKYSTNEINIGYRWAAFAFHNRGVTNW